MTSSIRRVVSWQQWTTTKDGVSSHICRRLINKRSNGAKLMASSPGLSRPPPYLSPQAGEVGWGMTQRHIIRMAGTSPAMTKWEPTRVLHPILVGSSKHDPRLAAMHFAISDDLICDSASHVYRDGKSHARIGARAEEGGIHADELAAQIDHIYS